MGKGDKRSRKGKIFRGTSGKTRNKKSKKIALKKRIEEAKKA